MSVTVSPEGVKNMEYAQCWIEQMAPRTGDVRAELVAEAAEFLGIPLDVSWHRLKDAGQRFRDEWATSVADATNAGELTSFYNQSDTELYELIEWHASDPIHYRTLIVRDLAIRSDGRAYLDYGSGIGSDAVIFGNAGFSVTLADISDILLAFAAYRCRRRNVPTRIVDLKRESLPHDAFDVVLCLDVLEHIPDPLRIVRTIHDAMRPQGLLVVHAPFGEDPAHPMHVVHHDVVTPRLRALGFQPVDCWFPAEVRAPLLYRKQSVDAVDRLGYYVYDGYLKSTAVGPRLASLYRRLRRGMLATSA
jgi:2-polyprenyl-3-methyl-5-hydroxy-6-metoxy-1,4-benzoquinol methylase